MGKHLAGPYCQLLPQSITFRIMDVAQSLASSASAGPPITSSGSTDARFRSGGGGGIAMLATKLPGKWPWPCPQPLYDVLGWVQEPAAETESVDHTLLPAKMPRCGVPPVVWPIGIFTEWRAGIYWLASCEPKLCSSGS